MMTINFNIDPYLWANYLKSHPKGTILVDKGFIYCAPDGIKTEDEARGRFSDNDEARITLIEAGWVQYSFGEAPCFRAKTTPANPVLLDTIRDLTHVIDRLETHNTRISADLKILNPEITFAGREIIHLHSILASLNLMYDGTVLSESVTALVQA